MFLKVAYIKMKITPNLTDQGGDYPGLVTLLGDNWGGKGQEVSERNCSAFNDKKKNHQFLL